MEPRPKFDADEESPQEIIERISEITDVLFPAPHWGYGLVVMLATPFLLTFLFADYLPEPGGMRAAALAVLGVFVVPALLFAMISHRFARLLGGTFHRRRAWFLASNVLLFQIVIVLIGGVIAIRGFLPFKDLLILAHAFTYLPHQTALFFSSDHRHLRSALVSTLHPLMGILAIHYVFPTGPREIWLSVLLPAMFLLTTVYFTELVDAPVRRNTRLSLSEMFRHYLDHLHTGSGEEAERKIERIAEDIDAHLGAVAFRCPDGRVKCAFVVPAVHPGPIGHLGGSNMPAKIVAAVKETSNILVPHGPATHDFNPASSREVERIAEESRRLMQEMEYSDEASPMLRKGQDAQVCAQFFGNGVLLTYTSWPKPIDDVDYSVGQAAMFRSRMAGAADALFIDAHNSLVVGSGAVFPSTRRAHEIEELSDAATRSAAETAGQPLQVGYAQDSQTFSREHGIGEQGCQVIVTEVGSKRSAYILWDGNNMMPNVRAEIRDRIQGLVDEFEVMTTDNHSVNAVAGAYNPVGHRLGHDRIAQTTENVVREAIEDLEPASVGLKTTRIKGLKVLGHWNTMRLVASVHTIVSTIPRAAAALLVIQAALAALIMLGVGAFHDPAPRG